MAQPATVDSPQIFISYHADDQGFINRLVSKLDSAAHKYGIWLDQLTGDTRVQIAERTRTAVKRAEVAVLLVSKRYLAATWAVSEEGSELLRSLPAGRQPLRFLMVDVKTAEELSGFAGVSYRRVNDVVLVEETLERQEDVLAGVVSMVERLLKLYEDRATAAQDNSPQLKIADLPRFERSAEVKNVLRRACRLAVAAARIPPIVTPLGLLFGLAEGGRVEVDYLRAPQFLWKELTAQGVEVYQKALIEEFPGLAPFDEHSRRTIDSLAANVDLVTPDTVRVFELAEVLAHVTQEKPPEIGTRHLLGALLLLDPNGSISRALTAIVGDVAALRKRFYDFVIQNLPDDHRAAWESILINSTVPETSQILLNQPAAPIKEPASQPTVAGFMADDWPGRDLLGIERDVNALASLVAAYKVEPPLSIGLFGDWGSGKSHFMRQMRKRIDLLSKEARDSQRPQKELGYYKNIVQIEFNAWHYIEGNLWASLVDHIFANLKLSEREDPSYAEQRRDELMQRLGVKEDIQKKINSRVQEREDDLRKLNERKQQAEADLDKAATQLEGFREEAVSSLEKLNVPVAFTAEQREVLGRLGIDAGTEISAADVRRNYLKMKTGWNGLKARLRLFLTDPSAKRRYLFSALLALIPIAGGLLVNFKGFPGLPTTVATVLGFVATVYVAVKPAWVQFRESLSALEKYDEEVERKRRQSITQLEGEVRALTRKIVDARLEGESVGKEVEKLKADIQNTSSSRILAEFIEDRAAATDYRRHLGLLALIRRDFEKLRDLFQQQREEASEGNGAADDKRIDRIVLYIDDLDRCPPDRVVQVLQAIHLLLAFPLFVVVVGVDSRWITRSLEQSYVWLQEPQDGAVNDDENGDSQSRDDNRLTGRGATPHDYLEKIFQIPFWLRSMTNEACLTYIDGLTEETTGGNVTERKQKLEEQATTQEQPIRAVESPGTVTAPVSHIDVNITDNKPPQGLPAELKQPISSSVTPKAEKIPSKIDLAPSSLSLTSYEVDFMKKLVPLIGRSPRAVKRFLNCYRLIKVGLVPEEFEVFVGENGESDRYKATMLLLGVITGAPTVSSYVMDELNPLRETKPTDIKTLTNALEGNAELQQQADAERFFAFLKYHEFGEKTELLFTEMVRCARTVSRFSFRVNRAAALR